MEGGVVQCCDWSDALGGRQTPTEHREVFLSRLPRRICHTPALHLTAAAGSSFGVCTG